MVWAVYGWAVWGLLDVRIGKGRGSGKSGGLSGNGGRVFPHPPSDPSGVSENMAAGSLESWP